MFPAYSNSSAIGYLLFSQGVTHLDATGDLRIILATDSAPEHRTRIQLARLVQQYGLARWYFTDTVRIEEGAISHSHPVLTLNTRYLDDDDLLLADYIHEQLHWFSKDGTGRVSAAMQELEPRYPDLPIDLPDGGGHRFGTYLHLVICFLEYEALIQLLGAVRARQAVQRRHVYRSIYATIVRERDSISKIVARHRAFPGTEHAPFYSDGC
jgi:hypothetical protein